MTLPQASNDKPREIAAVDLGSNSFHMVVARVVGQGLQIISRHKQRVRLAAGLDKKQRLSDEAIQRGVDCLAMFAERLNGIEIDNVRIAATHTLRQAKNAHEFIERANQVFPYPIEIIAGEEEARLIYLGVSHTQQNLGRRLVIDIGGGSTELVIGEDFQPLLVNSKRMGCVSYNERFFPQGALSEKQFLAAQTATQQKLESLASQYRKAGWQVALGASGTIKAIREVVIGLGDEDGIITRKRLDNVIEKLLKFKHSDSIDLPGLTEDRQPVFAAGVAILSGVLDALKIDELRFSDGALREGLLYEMEERFQRTDIRGRTTDDMAARYNVDLDHARRVQQTAAHFYAQAEPEQGSKKTELAGLLNWAALLHEVGLSIGYPGYHKHSAYILSNTNLPGFNQEQQTVLATLARFHRKALKLGEMPKFTLFKPKLIETLICALRLACVLHSQRNDEALPEITVTIDKNGGWQLQFPKGWLGDNRLLAADLTAEQDYWQAAGWSLCFSD
ncbi:exopolyphosphatase [Salinivibrio sp. SS2]|uniref:exopolyphosphatase n=1 Tax=Salinivibrio sp. SS2 TaxID=1892894 RepID=UPI00084C75AC|nr:exopolyphosphatase [Salinivibrio sp. DV]ODP96880.1 exopolyphosphatase [Salinivibrio sp. DV]